jgi:hypothetical protein
MAPKPPSTKPPEPPFIVFRYCDTRFCDKTLEQCTKCTKCGYFYGPGSNKNGKKVTF